MVEEAKVDALGKSEQTTGLYTMFEARTPVGYPASKILTMLKGRTGKRVMHPESGGPPKFIRSREFASSSAQDDDMDLHPYDF